MPATVDRAQVPRLRLGLALLAGVALAVLLIRGSWFSDRALFEVRSALNLSHFLTPAFNLGQKVGSDGFSPWIWLLAAEFSLGAPALQAAALTEAILIIGAVFLLGRIAWVSLPTGSGPNEGPRDIAKLVAVPAVLLGCVPFRVTVASGGEYALAFFLTALFGALLTPGPVKGSSGRVAFASLVFSLLVLTRPELAFALAPAVLWIGWRHRGRLGAHALGLAMGTSPLLIFLAAGACGLATFQSGDPWARLMNPLHRQDVLRHGLIYLIDAAVRSPLSLFTLASSVMAGLWTLRGPGKQPLPLLFSIGGVASLAFVVAKGGGDTSGVLLCGPLAFAGLALALSRPFPVGSVLFLAAYLAIFFDPGKVISRPGVEPAFPRTVELFREWGVRDEILTQGTRTPGAIEHAVSKAQGLWTATGRTTASKRFAISGEPGLDGLRLGPAVAILDRRLIADPRSALPGILPVDPRWSADISPEPGGVVQLAVRVKEEPVGTVEPILTAGTFPDSVQVAVEHEAGRSIRFRIRRGKEIFFSPVVRSFAFDALHELIADYGPAAAGGSSPAALQLALDGTRLWELPTSLRRIARRVSLGELSVGWNLAEDPTCTERFSGSIESVRASSAQALDSLRWPNSPPDGSEFELGIRFSTAVGSEPLLSTGREGSSDVIIAERSAPGSVSIGLAHGDLLPVYGTPLDIDDGAFHRILVRVGPFFAHDPGLFPKDRVSVQIDGRQALYLQEELYPFAPHEVHFLDNPLGNTRCKRDFGGEIREVVTRESPVSGNALRTIIRGGHGAITFLVRLDGNNITRGMGLVETGRPGAGDVLSVTRTDARHVRFSFDHWGLGGPTGPILEVDPATPHVITVDMDSLHAGAGQNPKEEVKVTLDGAMALSGHSACYPCDPEEIYLLQNKFNSSGVSGPFDGSCLSVSRAP